MARFVVEAAANGGCVVSEDGLLVIVISNDEGYEGQAGDAPSSQGSVIFDDGPAKDHPRRNGEQPDAAAVSVGSIVTYHDAS